MKQKSKPQKIVPHKNRDVLNLPQWPQFSNEDVDAAARVLRSGKVNYWTGNETKLFEREYASICARTFGIAVANGTLGLELAWQMLGIEPGDEVILAARGFIACATSVAKLGGVPVFADVCRDSQNLTIASIQEAYSSKTKAVLFVHLGGWPGGMEEVVDCTNALDIALVEDCSQAHGAAWNGKPVGSFGDISVFSFCQDKIMTTAGEGGMVLTNSERLHSRGCAYRDHGRDTQVKTDSAGEYQYFRNSIGSNFRMTEIQAAVGRSQLGKLAKWSENRRYNAAILANILQDSPALRVVTPTAQVTHGFYRYYCYLRLDQLKPEWNRERFLKAVNKFGVNAQSGPCPEMYREVVFGDLPFRKCSLPVTLELKDSSIALPVHPGIEEDQLASMARIICEVASLASLPKVTTRD